MTHPALLFLILSGFVVTLLNGWGIFYKADLILHPLLGIGFTALMYYFAWRRFSRLGPKFSARRWVGLPIVLSLLFAVPGIATRSPGRFYLLVFVLVAVLSVGLTRLARAVELREWLVAAFNYGGFGIWTVSVLSGLSTLLLSQGGGITHIAMFHRTVDVVFVVFYVLMIVLSLSGVLATSRAFADEQPRIWASVVALASRVGDVKVEQPKAWSALMMTALAAGVLGGAVAIERMADTSAPSFTVPLSTMPFERRPEGDRAAFFSDARVAPAALQLTESCEGCHKGIADSLRESNHSFSMATPHFHKSLELMKSEVGEHNTQACMGCHAPAALFDKSKGESYFAHHDNISCSFCHMVTDASISTDGSKRSNYTIRPPVGHLDLFLKDGVEKTPGFIDSFLIRLSPLSHARQFSPSLLNKDRFCESCHQQQIPQERQLGLARPRCIDCHMRTLSELGSEGAVRSHMTPGANVAVPTLAGRSDAVGVVTRWIAGNFPFSIPGWENRGWERLGGRPQATWLWMLFESKKEPQPGKEFTVNIRTGNVGMEHPFPAAPFDLIDAWQEMQVTDARGQVIYRNGYADAAGHIPPEAHRLGGTVMGENGKPIEHYSVWQPQHDVIDRVIDEGRTVDDRYTFMIPKDVQGPLAITAEWKYRKLNREFMDWAYGPQVTTPALSVGSLSGHIELAPVQWTAAEH